MVEVLPPADGVTPIFTKIGAFIRRGEEPVQFVAYGAVTQLEDNGITYVVPLLIEGAHYSYPLTSESDLTINKNTGTIDFKAFDTEYTIRELREEDGYWMSSLKMPLSVPILEGMAENARKKNNMAEVPGSDVDINDSEKLIAYAFDDSLYVVGLVYSNDTGRWLRVGADWILMSADDDTFEGASSIIIDPDRADEYVDLYDANHMPVSDTEEFEYVSETEEPKEEPTTPAEK